MVEEKLGRSLREGEQKPEITLESLGLDSLDRMELSIAIEGRFGFRSDEVPASMGDLWTMAAGLVEQAPPKPAPPRWFLQSSGATELRLLGVTIREAFVRRALLNPRDVAVADDLSGALTYERLLVGARLLALQLQAVKSPNIGLMMPASVAGDVVFLAAHLAGKLPVMLNWTTGPANLAHAARTMELTHVVTSKAFVDRTGVAIDDVQYLFLEELRGRVSRLALLGQLLAVRWETWCGRRSIGPRIEMGIVAGSAGAAAVAIIAGIVWRTGWLWAAGSVFMIAALALFAIVRLARHPVGLADRMGDRDGRFTCKSSIGCGAGVSPVPGRHGGRPLRNDGTEPQPLAGASGRVDAANAPAVVLFTSGSEKAPKAVPLTHRNILSNLQSVIDAYDISRRDSLIGFLPSFHSFGLTVTTLLPLLTGVRVVHHPDPTDASGLARKIAGYRPTVLAGTPTFVKYILDRSRREDLSSLRLIVVGAEKCPESLFERVGELAPQAHLLEGYGITECAPMVAANRIERNRPGSIGLPLPGVDMRVVHPDSFEPLEPGEMGMLLVSGENVFPGYITPAGGDRPADPFLEQGGRRWYVTGDLASIDPEGFIHFSGRLRRFLKTGGEMISLPAIEEPLVRRYPPGEEGPRVAVEGIELPGSGRRIVLFTTEPLRLSEANAILTEHGLRGIMRIDEVRRINAIPVLGTGKTDYKVLRAQIAHAATTTS
jgi:acyl-CoA synthetase (AMP-forming)/AMP-acid ligase II/acyl carrier protein